MKIPGRPITQLLAVMAAGMILETIYVLFLARLFPIALDHVPRIGDFTQIIREGRTEGFASIAALIALFVPYVAALRMVRNLRRNVALVVVLAFAIVFAVTSLATLPVGSADIYGYIFQGKVLAVYHGNPYTVTPADLPSDEVVSFLYWIDEPSTYGPLWVLLGAPIALISSSLPINLLAFKGLAVVLYLATTLVIYLAVRRERPDGAPASALFFAWNPLVVFEALVNGHNDIAMALFLYQLFIDRPYILRGRSIAWSPGG